MQILRDHHFHGMKPGSSLLTISLRKYICYICVERQMTFIQNLKVLLNYISS
jgi:hypothetical protein